MTPTTRLRFMMLWSAVVGANLVVAIGAAINGTWLAVAINGACAIWSEYMRRYNLKHYLESPR